MRTQSVNRFDAAVGLFIKATSIGFIGLLAATFFVKFNSVWILIYFTLGLLACITAILLKGAITGKRYMQGAKHRREKLFPMFFRKDESLADEALKLWQENQGKV